MGNIKPSNIPNRLRNVSAEHPYVAGAVDIYDDAKGENQQSINAETDASLADRYTKSETYSKEQLNNLITTPEQEFVTLTAEDGDTLADIFDGITGTSDTIYRVGNWDGEQYDTTVYSEYAWDGTVFQFLSKKQPGIDDMLKSGSHNISETDAIVKGVIDASKGFVVDYSHAIILSSGTISYRSSANYDCIWIPVPENVKQIQIKGITLTESYFYFSSMTPSTETYLGNDTKGLVPDGAKLVLRSLLKSSNVNYDDAYISYDYRIDNLTMSLFADALTSGHATIDYDHMVNVTDTGIKYEAKNTFDCLWIFVKEGTTKITVTGVVFTTYYFYDTLSPQSSTPTSNTTGVVPSGARLCLIDLSHASNTGGYGNLSVTQDYNYLYNRVPIGKTAAETAKGYVVVKDKICNYVNDQVGIEDNPNYDLVLIYLKPYTSYLSLSGVTYSHIFYFSSFDVNIGNLLAWGGNYVPDGAILAAVDVSHASNAADYYKAIDISYQYDTVSSQDIRLMEYNTRRKTVETIEPDEVLSNTKCQNGEVKSSSNFDLWVFNNIDPSDTYCFSGKFIRTINIYFVSYWDSDDNFISYDSYKGSMTEDTDYHNALLNIPVGTSTVKINVLHGYDSQYSLGSVTLGDYYDMDTALASSDAAPLKVVVNTDKSFHVRHSLDDVNDGILVFNYNNTYGDSQKTIRLESYNIGAKSGSDKEIMASEYSQLCNDCWSPMSTANFGPLGENHGYSIPRVVITGHTLTNEDIGTEWYDQNDYHYTIGKIDGDYIYLLPVIYSTGVPGYETRQWKWYSSPAPTRITRNVTGGETLTVASYLRWDLKIASLNDVKVIIDGKEVEAEPICARMSHLSSSRLCITRLLWMNGSRHQYLTVNC